MEWVFVKNIYLTRCFYMLVSHKGSASTTRTGSFEEPSLNWSDSGKVGQWNKNLKVVVVFLKSANVYCIIVMPPPP